MFDLNPVVPVPAALVATELANAERKIARWEQRLASGIFSERTEPMVRANLAVHRDLVRVLRSRIAQEG